jgi:hypothetical protein
MAVLNCQITRVIRKLFSERQSLSKASFMDFKGLQANIEADGEAIEQAGERITEVREGFAEKKDDYGSRTLANKIHYPTVPPDRAVHLYNPNANTNSLPLHIYAYIYRRRFSN